MGRLGFLLLFFFFAPGSPTGASFFLRDGDTEDPEDNSTLWAASTVPGSGALVEQEEVEATEREASLFFLEAEAEEAEAEALEAPVEEAPVDFFFPLADFDLALADRFGDWGLEEEDCAPEAEPGFDLDLVRTAFFLHTGGSCCCG